MIGLLAAAHAESAGRKHCGNIVEIDAEALRGSPFIVELLMAFATSRDAGGGLARRDPHHPAHPPYT
jgi:hypothetical protein